MSGKVNLASEVDGGFWGCLCHLHDALASQLLDLCNQLVILVEACDIVASSNALAVDQNIRDCASAGRLQECGLQLRAQRVQVELLHVGSRDNVVLLKQDSLCLLRVRAVTLGEDDDCVFVLVYL